MNVSDSLPASFATFPDTARVWLFGTDRALDAAETRRLEHEIDAFTRGWMAHGAPLRATHATLESRFVVVAADETACAASGCSIDALLRRIGELEAAVGVSLRDGARIWYRIRNGDIVCCDRQTFRMRAERGEIDAATPVFDTTIQTLGDLRAGRFERPAGAAWHARLLPALETAPDA